MFLYVSELTKIDRYIVKITQISIVYVNFCLLRWKWQKMPKKKFLVERDNSSTNLGKPQKNRSFLIGPATKRGEGGMGLATKKNSVF